MIGRRTIFAGTGASQPLPLIPALASLALHGAVLAAIVAREPADPPPIVIPVALMIEGSAAAAASEPMPVAAPEIAADAAPVTAAPTAPEWPEPAPPVPAAQPKHKPRHVALAANGVGPAASADHTATAAPAASAAPAANAQVASTPPPATPFAEPGPGAGAASAAAAGGDGDYLAAVIASLARHKHYPEAARQRGEGGTAVIAFAIDRGGRVLSFDLRRSSGHPTLDSAAETMVRDADPLPAPPASYRGERIELVVPVTFDLR